MSQVVRQKGEGYRPPTPITGAVEPPSGKSKSVGKKPKPKPKCAKELAPAFTELSGSAPSYRLMLLDHKPSRDEVRNLVWMAVEDKWCSHWKANCIRELSRSTTEQFAADMRRHRVSVKRVAESGTWKWKVVVSAS